MAIFRQCGRAICVFRSIEITALRFVIVRIASKSLLISADNFRKWRWKRCTALWVMCKRRAIANAKKRCRRLSKIDVRNVGRVSSRAGGGSCSHDLTRTSRRYVYIRRSPTTPSHFPSTVVYVVVSYLPRVLGFLTPTRVFKFVQGGLTFWNSKKNYTDS